MSVAIVDVLFCVYGRGDPPGIDNGKGGLTMGRGRWGGDAGHFTNTNVNYAGTLSCICVQNLVTGDFSIAKIGYRRLSDRFVPRRRQAPT